MDTTSQEQKLLPVEEEHKLLDRPAEERLREELEEEKHADSAKPKQPAPEKPKPSRKWLVLVVIVAFVLAALLFLLGYLPRERREQTTKSNAQREATAIPLVDVVKVKRSPDITRLLLPGTITPLIEAPLYARASGYIVKRYVDIGDRVRPNQLMAVIEAPDLDQQVAQGRAALSQARQQLGQAQATLEQSQAQLALAKVTWDRYAVLVTKGAVARQDADQQKANYDSTGAVVDSNKANIRAAQDNVQAAQANLDRLIALQSYKEIRAPFAGVVTARNIDVGSYVSTTGGQSGSTTYAAAQSLGATSTNTSNGALFTVADISRLRILLEVPQSDAPSVQVGQEADLLVGEYRGKRFQGKITRTSNSLDATTRTLLTEVQVANVKGELLPGMYTNVQLSNTRSNPPILIPGDAIITRPSGQYVAVLRDPDQKREQNAVQREKQSGEQVHEEAKELHLEKVEIGRDYGTATEILSGLQGWEYIVTNPSDEVYEGALVMPTQAPDPQGATPSGNGAGNAATAGTSAGGGPSKGGAGQSH
jgi:multidrug efflux pump subunit AcrA (membrane-fusion protein)